MTLGRSLTTPEGHLCSLLISNILFTPRFLLSALCPHLLPVCTETILKENFLYGASGKKAMGILRSGLWHASRIYLLE